MNQNWTHSILWHKIIKIFMIRDHDVEKLKLPISDFFSTFFNFLKVSVTNSTLGVSEIHSFANLFWKFEQSNIITKKYGNIHYRDFLFKMIIRKYLVRIFFIYFFSSCQNVYALQKYIYFIIEYVFSRIWYLKWLCGFWGTPVFEVHIPVVLNYILQPQ